MGGVWKPSRPDPKKPGKRIKYRVYYIWWLDENGRRCKQKAFSDKGASEALLRRKEVEVERRKAGLPVAEEEARPLAAAVGQYVGELETQGRSSSHLYETRRLLAAVIDYCGWVTVRDIRADGLRSFWKDRLAGKSPRTLNSYRNALVAFCNWCVGQKPPLLAENPVSHVKKARAAGGKQTRPRRAYTLAEWRALCAVGVALDEMRGLIYLVAGLSGLRRSELRRLQKRDLTPDGPFPSWHLRPEIQKGRRFERVPMLAECADLIRPIWESLPTPGSPLWTTWPRHQTFDKDLRRAGIAKRDSEGRAVDFHSLRYFFCTQMGERLPIQRVRILMRHRDIRTTCNLYMQLGMTDVAEGGWVPPAILGW